MLRAFAALRRSRLDNAMDWARIEMRGDIGCRGIIAMKEQQERQELLGQALAPFGGMAHGYKSEAPRIALWDTTRVKPREARITIDVVIPAFNEGRQFW